ncbi:hypothetical protein KSP40_PGU009540 [Platanthera guangdongensis]|uniref:Uncharacterized protein n=1 Tax=Platanthera guangdongensis TaxID=2320717 RepID=A0ABR2LMU4_9ASPA
MVSTSHYLLLVKFVWSLYYYVILSRHPSWRSSPSLQRTMDPFADILFGRSTTNAITRCPGEIGPA